MTSQTPTPGTQFIQTVFGPCLPEGKTATYWECVLRNLTSSLVHFEETGCLITGRLPGAKAINALIQAEKNPDNAPARLSRIVKEQGRRHIDGATIRDMMIQKKSFLVLDWNSKGSFLVNEQGWTNIE